MKRSVYFLILLMVSFLFIIGCKKDLPIDKKTDPDLPPFNPTAFNLEMPDHLPPLVIPADNKLTKEGVDLGRFLFYDSTLSVNGKISCGSCHSASAGFSDNVAFSTGAHGMLGKRNSMPLFNLGFMENFFWDGRANSLEEQILMPIVDHLEMAESLPHVMHKLNNHPEYPKLFYAAFGTTEITPQLLAKAIAQFLRIIISADSKFDRIYYKQDGFFEDDEWDGFLLFNSEVGADCFHCHGEGNGLFGDFKFKNNGLDVATTIHDFPDKGRGAVTGKPEDYGLFKTPSLRNLLLTAPYMHDGRFNTLEEVVEHYSTGLKVSPNQSAFELKNASKGGAQLTQDQKKDLVAFLKTLNDTTFIHNPLYQNPYKK